MADVYEVARELVKALRETEACHKMRRMASRVRADSRLESMITEFRQRQFDAQAAQLQGRQPSEEQVARIEKLGKAIQEEPHLRDYLQAETAYGQVLVEVQQILAEAYNPDALPGKVRTRR